MPDRVSTLPLPGYASNYLNQDFLVATLGVASQLTRVQMGQTDYDDSGASDTSVTGSIRNATAGGGSGIAFVIPDQGQSVVVADETLDVAADESIYLRLTAGGTSMNVAGWIEIEGAAGITAALTNLARVKEFLRISGSGNDSLLNNLIAAVNLEIQKDLGRSILQQTGTIEMIDSIGDHRIMVEHYPIISITSVYEGETLLVEDTDYEATAEDLLAGQIVRISGGKPVSWAKGRRAVKVTHNNGYATVPAPIVQAATELVCFDYRTSTPGGSRLGLSAKVADAGGDASYTSRQDLWEAQKHRLAPYARKVF